MLLAPQGAPHAQGTQQRTVECVAKEGGQPVDESACAGERPAGERACSCSSNAVAAAASGWRTGPWGHCSKSCGGGTQARRVACSSNDCDDQDKPPTYQTCNHHACPSWSQDDWGKVGTRPGSVRADLALLSCQC